MKLPHYLDSQFFKKYLRQANSARIVNIYTTFTVPHINKILENTDFYIEFDEKGKNYKYTLETITFDDLDYHKIEENSKNSTNAIVKNDIIGYLNCEKEKFADNGQKYEAALLETFEKMMAYALESRKKKIENYLTANEVFSLCGDIALNGSKNIKISVAKQKENSYENK